MNYCLKHRENLSNIITKENSSYKNWINSFNIIWSVIDSVHMCFQVKNKHNQLIDEQKLHPSFLCKNVECQVIGRKLTLDLTLRNFFGFFTRYERVRVRVNPTATGSRTGETTGSKWELGSGYGSTVPVGLPGKI